MTNPDGVPTMTQIAKQRWIDRMITIVPIILVMVGIAIASEHRMTVMEVNCTELQRMTALLYENQQKVIRTQEGITTILQILMREREIAMERRLNEY